jgi:hypothetical protein
VQGIFVGLTEAEILAIRAQTKTDITAGRVVTSYTAPSGISVGKQHLSAALKGGGMTPGEVLLECRYALQKINSGTYGTDLITTRTRARFP